MPPATPNPASAGAQTGLGDLESWAAIGPRHNGKFSSKQAPGVVAAPRLRLVAPPAPPRPLRKNVPKSKSSQICFKLQRDMAILQREVASLRQSIASLQNLSRVAVTIDSEEVATREAAKRKRIEEREAAKQEHAAFVAKQALIQPEKDRARAEWLAKDAARKREKKRLYCREWHAANPERSRAIYERAYQTRKELLAANPEMAKAVSERRHQKRKERIAARKQIDSSPDLLGGTPS